MLSAQNKQIIYDKDGKPLYVKDEIVVKFRPDLVNKTVVDNVEIQTGNLSEFVSPKFLDIAVSSGYFDAEIANLKVEKVFRRLKTTDTISISRLGRRVRIPEFWSTLLIHWKDEGRGAGFLEAIKKLNEAKPYIEFAEPSYVGRIQNLPNDTKINEQASLIPTAAFPNAHINADPAWDLATGTDDVKVGVYDTGIRWNHDDFFKSGNGTVFADSQIKGGWDWILQQDIPGHSTHDENGHGTAVAGIIGAMRNNDLGIAGIAGGNGANDKGVQLFSMKISDVLGQWFPIFFADAVVEGASYIPAVLIPHANPHPQFGYGLHIMNASIGDTPNSKNVEAAMKFAFENEVVFVAGSGNDGKAIETFPADYSDDWVLKVGASNENGDWASFSNTGGAIDLVAPGVESIIRSLKHDEITGYREFDGTSASAPHVAGAAALMLSYKPLLAPEDIEILFQKSATDIGVAGWDAFTGSGKLNIGLALQSIRAPRFDVKHYNMLFSPSTATITKNPVNSFGLVSNFVYAAGAYKAEICTIRKEINITQPLGTKVLDVWVRNVSSTVVNSSIIPHHEGLKVISFTQNKAIVEGKAYHLIGNSLGQSIDVWLPATGLDGKMSISVYTEDMNATKSVEIPIQEEYTRIVPNPNTGNCKVLFTLFKDTNLKVQVLDIMGREVFVIPSSFQSEGHKEIELNLSKVNKGVYFCNLITSESTVTKKIIIQ
jgi:subtilisin family serine protease